MAGRTLATIIAGPLAGLSGDLISNENSRSLVRVTEGERSILVELDQELVGVVTAEQTRKAKQSAH